MAQKHITAISITAPVTKNGIITQNALMQTYQPKTHFCGGSIKWYEDKPIKN